MVAAYPPVLYLNLTHLDDDDNDDDDEKRSSRPRQRKEPQRKGRHGPHTDTTLLTDTVSEHQNSVVASGN